MTEAGISMMVLVATSRPLKVGLVATHGVACNHVAEILLVSTSSIRREAALVLDITEFVRKMDAKSGNYLMNMTVLS